MCLPIHSPDLWWHLNAGRWIFAHRAVPFADPFSFTRGGEAWLDFEWLQQLLWYGVHALGGLPGLWLLKGASLAAAYVPVDGLLRDKGAGTGARAAALALWACAALPMADLRADLVTAALFAVLLRRLESGRASFLFGFGVFALWANLHAGFPVGLALYAAYALAPRFGGRAVEGLAAEAFGAALGALMTPFGLQLYAVFAAHGSDPIRRFVMEWGPVDWAYRYHRPLIAALVAGAAAARAARRSAPALAAAAAVLALGTAASSRLAVVFAPAGAAALGVAFPALSLEACAWTLAAAAAMIVASTRGARFGRAYSDVFVDRPAVDFVVGHPELFSGLATFNTYEWGGYLGWRLGPGGKVFGDGRYLFHGQLSEINEALGSPEAMAAFVERRGLGALLIRRYPQMIRGTILFPGGERVEVARPWHVALLPRERWALVYADERGLVFVDRSKVPADRLAAVELRDRPGDEAARDAFAARAGDGSHPAPKQNRR